MKTIFYFLSFPLVSYLMFLSLGTEKTFSVVQGQEDLSDYNTEVVLGCIPKGEFVRGRDYYKDHKVKTSYSKTFNVEYYGSYKIIRSVRSGFSILATQCGTQPPPNIETKAEVTIPIQRNIKIQRSEQNELPAPSVIDPRGSAHDNVGGVVLDSVSYLKFLEILGVTDEISGYTGALYQSSSPCVRDAIASRDMTLIGFDPSLTGLDNKQLKSMNVDATFTAAHPSAYQAMLVDIGKESSALGVAEYVKFFAAFFNKEDAANAYFEELEGRYTCIQEKKPPVKDRIALPPQVLWATRTQMGWLVMQCPGVECSLVQDAGAELVAPAFMSNDQKSYLNDQDFADLAAMADVLIYGGDLKTIYDYSVSRDSSFYKLVDGIPAVQEGRVYDTNGAGPVAWTEEAILAPDVLLADLMSTLYEEQPEFDVKRTYLRKPLDGGDILKRDGTLIDTKNPEQKCEKIEPKLYLIKSDLSVSCSLSNRRKLPKTFLR